MGRANADQVYDPDVHQSLGQRISYPARWEARLFAAFFPASRNPDFPLVCTAFKAALRRSSMPRSREDLRVCFDRALWDALECGSCCSTRSRAREAVGEGVCLLCDWPASYSRSALFLVLSFVLPFLGGRKGTPARRASLRPIAIACCGDRAPCFPSRTCSISSWTNSPAAVDGDSLP
jgi:hypothetical protein